ncbi:MAG TPA: caspase family protein [Pseudonocardiaceae bacterium]|jgi:hypothetical protein
MSTPSQEQRFPDGAASRAVLIGASGFRSTRLPDIPAVLANLLGLQRALTYPRLGPLTRQHCVVLSEPKDAAAVGSTLAAAAREATDLLLVYYAGHGLLDDDGLLHLALPSTDPDNVGYTAIPLDLIKRDVGKARARVRVLILDCCFSGQAVAAMATPASVVAGQLNLTGTYILTSTTATAPSHATPGARYTAFTGALLHALSNPKPLSLNGIYRRVDAELGGLGLPRPQRRSANTAAELVLVRGRIPAADQPGTRAVRPEAMAARPKSAISGASYRVEPRPAAILGALVFFFGALAGTGWMLSQAGSDPSVLAWAIGLGLLFVGIGISGFVEVEAKRLELTKDGLVVHRKSRKMQTIAWAELIRITLSARKRGTPPRQYCEVIIVRRSSRPNAPDLKIELKDAFVSMGDLAKALRGLAPPDFDIRQVTTGR